MRYEKMLSTIDWSLQLPTELTLEVFEYLDVQSLCRLASTCRAWQGLATQPSLWYAMCCRTQSNPDPDRSLHWKEKFKERVSYRKRFLNRKLARRYMFLILSSSVCLLLAAYSLRQAYIQHRHLTKYDVIQGRVNKIDIIEHESSNEDSERQFNYEFILHYSYNDKNGVEWRSWNLWPLALANDEYSSSDEAINAAYEIGKVDDIIQIYVDFSEHPPYSYLIRSAVFEPFFYLILSLIGLCIMALTDAMSYSVLHINPDTTDLKTFVSCLGRYMYPILDNRLDDSKLRKQQGAMLSVIAVLFHMIGFSSITYYVKHSADTSVLWLFCLFAEPVGLYTAYQGWKRFSSCRFQPLLFCDQRPYLLLGSSNMLHIVFQTERRFFAHNITLTSSLTRADQEIITIPGEPNRSRIVYTPVFEQDVACRNGMNQWIHPGQCYIDNVEVVIPNRLQESSPANQATFPRYVWNLSIKVFSNGPVFSKQLVVLVKQPLI